MYMEDGLERNFTWLKMKDNHSSFSKQNDELDPNDREKKVFDKPELIEKEKNIYKNNCDVK